jgi:UDP-N-acetyl-D-glucosamine dehydrogenase
MVKKGSNIRGKVVIVGQGYVGLPLALALAKAEWQVVGYDISEATVSRLNSGQSHIEDVSNLELNSALESRNYRASSRVTEFRDAEICVICVPTPLSSQGEPDLYFLESAIRMMANHLDPQALVINESTSYPGTVREFIMPLMNSLRSDGANKMLFASAPERIDPGNKSWSLSNTTRIISGINKMSTEKTLSFYQTICNKVVEVSSPEVAEMAKLMENTFRQVNIALVNQLVPFCRTINVNMQEVIDAAGSKPHGFMKFYPGAGVGGHCIPVDPLYLLWRSRQLGLDLPFIAQADLVNSSMASYVVSRLIEIAKPERGDFLAVLGVGYKKGISDIRETPAINVGQAIMDKGFVPLWLDPLVREFRYFERWDGQQIRGAVVVTAQPGLPVKRLAKLGIPILDCTGEFRFEAGVENL